MAAILLFLVGISTVSASIKGVPFEKLSFYDKGRDFSCLDGSQSIPFSYVNDDYCDCSDGSDEPGTAACDNSQFYCENKEHEPRYLQSSRVNDGICDCCDGSDEWDSEVTCPNTCIELGRRVKEEMRKLQEIEQQGHQKRFEYSSQGRQKREEYERDLSQVESDMGVVSSEVESLRQAKEEAEEPESRKKQEHLERWEEEKAAIKEEKRTTAAFNTFKELDTDSNNELSLEEIMVKQELDDDGDGILSVDEARIYLDGDTPVDFQTFKDKSWDLVEAQLKDERETEREEERNNGNDKDINEDDMDDDDDDEEEGKEEEEGGEETLEMPPYDEETHQLIEAADSARQLLREVEERERNLDSRKKDLEKYLGTSFGEDHEFSPLFEQCYEYTDREYTYKLCMFEKVTQRGKNGGRETSLGNWDKWNGNEGSKFNSMLYSKGEKCWNGPDRSIVVHLKCGVEDKIVSAYEPNKCEYAMDFTTPALCRGEVNGKPRNIRVEL